ncbi:hypothetical protein C8E03_101410 [Lachnotalea glycerini]|uniref:DUF1980 domain-containing protein n=1 Tax=Lachnotalea glycerini TaxID=1763509 RepID=A0A255RWY5_9FIRM|nr:hypothetical protein [Lachnotalea glycerini]OYP44561.1 hypothetical protein CG709_04065 [Lachnotalea glycerini]PXV95780.1 hypothetical protein C8E03_101410 [Lachnotalea glycerini]RDY33154.1 hypothetical protein CG710_001110 [Lachnotalea glycerini]
MKRFLRIGFIVVMIISMNACSRQDSATSNSKMTQAQSSEESVSDDSSDKSMAEVLQTFDQTETNGTNTQSQYNQIDTTQSNTPPHSSLNYNCDIEKDRETFDDKNIDIVVGDNYYSTQINDWYMNFDQYEGKTVEIEGYYIADYLPYLFVGRYGPTCPYCQGAYVCFEFYTKQDLTQLISGQDWIKVKGILRKDTDESGEFYYIEAISIEKMDEAGLDTITN